MLEFTVMNRATLKGKGNLTMQLPKDNKYLGLKLPRLKSCLLLFFVGVKNLVFFGQ
jgi:hypothetical protein